MERFRTLDSGVVRVLFTSSVNLLMDDTDHLLSLIFEADEDVASGSYSLTIEKALMVTPEADYYEPVDRSVSFTVSDATGIGSREHDGRDLRHNVAGQRVDASHRGITIVKDKKRLFK